MPDVFRGTAGDAPEPPRWATAGLAILSCAAVLEYTLEHPYEALPLLAWLSLLSIVAWAASRYLKGGVG